MKILITGVNGFVGKHLSRFLLSKNIQVIGTGLEVSHQGSQEIRYHQTDILDSERVNQVIALAKPDAIIHLAGFSSVKKSFEQPELCRKINVDGTKNIFEAVLKAEINPKILIVSSAEIYGFPKEIPLSESTVISPSNPYSLSRKEQEELCHNYFQKFGLNIIVSRSFPHIGPGQLPIFVTSDFAKQIVEIENKLKEPVLEVGNLNAQRDFTDVRDIIKAYLLAVEKCLPGETYNICSNTLYSIQEILDKLLSLTSVKIQVKKNPAKMRPSDIPVLQGDNSKFIKATGWQPEITLEKSLKDVLDYWRERLTD